LRKNIAIEEEIILQKIEVGKELLIDDELSLKESTRQLGSSSLAHCSSQCNKVHRDNGAHLQEAKEHQARSHQQCVNRAGRSS
jgi:hypothetical protein